MALNGTFRPRLVRGGGVTANSVDRMEEDMGYLHSRLSKMGGFDDTAEYLLNIVKGKRPDKPPPVPAKNGTDATPNGEADTKAEEKSTETDSAK